MKSDLSPLVVVVVLVFLAAAIVGAYMMFAGPRTPAGVKYEPGVPPWMQKTADGKLVPKAGRAGLGGPGASPSPSGAPPDASGR